MALKPTVFVVDDDPAVRESLTELVQAMHFGVACYGSAEDFLSAYDHSCPGCLVLDVILPGLSGLDLQDRLKAEGIRVPLIMLTGHGDVRMVVRAMQQGAADFLEKPFHPNQLRESIRKAIELDAHWREQQAQRADLDQRLARLTPDEREVMQRIVAGKTNKVIAAELDVSVRTVQFRRSSIMEKLQVKSRAALMELILSMQGWNQ